MKKVILFLLVITALGSCKKENIKNAPTLSFTVNARALGDADYTIAPPSSNSSGAFTYTISNPAVATINGTTVSVKGVGTATVTATQAADGSYSEGTITQTLTVVPAGTYVLGQAVKGGVIFYINGSGIHGFMVSDVDVATSLPYSNGSLAVLSAANNNLTGGGVTNTNNIIAALGTTGDNYAALACRNYTGGGYTDWYLPCTIELTNVRLRKDLIGGLGDTNYWTSTEVTASPALATHIYFGNGTLTTTTIGSTTTTTITSWTFSKLATFSVRAIRVF